MFSEYPIFSSLGWTVLHFLWEGTVIGLLTAFALRCMTKCTAQSRYLLACLGLGVCLTVFIATASFQISTSDTTQSNHGLYAQNNSEIWLNGGDETFLVACTAIVWSLGVMIMLVRFSRQCYGAHLLKTRETTAPDSVWTEMYRELCRELKVSPKIRMLSSGLAETPMVVGWIAPVVLVPASAFVSLTPEQMRAVLAHELAHIHRFDHWMHLLQGMVEILLFFHPAIWWISNQINVERDYCCDETSVRTIGNPKMLVEALAQLETMRIASPNLVLAANGGSLLDRITRILGIPMNVNNKNKKSNMKIKTIATIVCTLCLSAGLITAQGASKKQNSKKASSKAALSVEKKQSNKKDAAKSKSNSESNSKSSSAKKTDAKDKKGDKSKSGSGSKSNSSSESKSQSNSPKKAGADKSKSSSGSKSESASASESKSNSGSKSGSKSSSKYGSESKSDSVNKSKSSSSSDSKSGSVSESNSDSKSKSSKAKGIKKGKKNKKVKSPKKDKRGKRSKKPKRK
jgi:bla regulator protein blaR1